MELEMEKGDRVLIKLQVITGDIGNPQIETHEEEGVIQGIYNRVIAAVARDGSTIWCFKEQIVKNITKEGTYPFKKELIE